MPIFEYECSQCGHQFEALVLPTFSAPKCPSCESRKLKKLISLCAVSSDETRQANAKKSIREQKRKYKDKAIADHEYFHTAMEDH